LPFSADSNYYKNKPVLKNIEKQKKAFLDKYKKLKLNKDCRINGLSKKEEYQIITYHIQDLERLVTADYSLQL
jgi:hypothetical protein